MFKHLTTNLFVPAPETTISGVTLTHADDGSFILNGTCTQDRYIYTTAPIKAGSYLLCSIDSDISDTTEIRLRNSGTAIAQFTLGAQSRSVAFTVSEDIAELQYSIRMGNGTVYSNFKVKPMLFKDVSIAPSSYIPYLNTPPELRISDGSGGYHYIGEMYKSDGNGGYEHVFSAGHDTTVTGNPLTMSDSRAKDISYEFSGNAKRTIEISSVEYIIPDTITLYTSVDDTDGNTYTPTGYVYPAKQGSTFGLYHFDTGVFQTEA